MLFILWSTVFSDQPQFIVPVTNHCLCQHKITLRNKITFFPVRKLLWVHGVAISLTTDASYISTKYPQSILQSLLLLYFICGFVGFFSLFSFFFLFFFFFKKLILKYTSVVNLPLLNLQNYDIFWLLYIPDCWENVLSYDSAIYIYIFVQ